MCRDTEKKKTLFFTGYSRFPENTSSHHVFGILSLEMEVEPETFQIVDVSCTLLPTLGEKFLIHTLIGKDMNSGLTSAIEEVESRYSSSEKKAIIAAIKDARRQFVEYRAKAQKNLLRL
jgi:hypothetical protein